MSTHGYHGTWTHPNRMRATPRSGVGPADKPDDRTKVVLEIKLPYRWKQAIAAKGGGSVSTGLRDIIQESGILD